MDPMTEETYFVVYHVTGFEGEKRGPYPWSDIRYQRDDIAGYEGVTDVSIMPASQVGEVP